MKLAEIMVGEEYAVTVNENQLDLSEPDEGFHVRRRRTLSTMHRSFHGYQARVVALETSEAGRTVVRVELPFRRPRTKERVEDNFDGTHTEWTGFVMDDDGRGVDDEETVEAVIQPSQVQILWTEAVVQLAVRRANYTLNTKRGWDRYFGGDDA